MMLSKLIAYDEWANRKVFEALQKVDSEDHKAETERMFAHILAAQKVWISRITGESSKVEIWPTLSTQEISALMKENPSELEALVSRGNEIISYQNSKGEEFQNTVEDIIMHVVIHGQHHRAQIAKIMRKAEITPPGTDYIFFLRTVDN